MIGLRGSENQEGTGDGTADENPHGSWGKKRFWVGVVHVKEFITLSLRFYKAIQGMSAEEQRAAMRSRGEREEKTARRAL